MLFCQQFLDNKLFKKLINKVIYSEIKASTQIVSAIKPNKSKYIKYSYNNFLLRIIK